MTNENISEYFRPNFWPNTPDILTEFLQSGSKPAFIIRLVLAATLSSNYGIYGPPFELMESEPREEGSEEYMNSEKYEIRNWGLEEEKSLKEIIAHVNEIRANNKALQQTRRLKFHPVDNDEIICYSKKSGDSGSGMIIVVNLDPYHKQSGWVNLQLDGLSIKGNQRFQVHDLLRESRYQWEGARNYIELDPNVMPAHIFQIRKHVHSEEDFDYYM